jgi:hypothetical protein
MHGNDMHSDLLDMPRVSGRLRYSSLGPLESVFQKPI